MLVLTRRPDQTLTFGGQADDTEAPIEVTVLEVRGDQVRLGVTAPEGVTVDRKEIWLDKRTKHAE